MSDIPSAEIPGEDRPARHRNPARARIVALVVIAVIAVVLVFQNSQHVTVRFWFITGHVRLIWLIVVSLVVGGVFGFVAGHRGGRRRRRD
jgi:uncharacterized integral membrane protein